ncbi:hypothetical protein A7X93_00390 [Stenotrophomonas maltophilia]|uniref:DUF6680 family protein n=1 Tax=Stenotrophomonas maltophilia TaxID=40324 RepID=UPI000DA8CE4A|nr:DUF6680 family protein [Stenotrophomonas maltophilia]PZT35100.1 hypothetical protein A7X93_00390 [Stenotrophomonas maltophilia]
MWDSLVNTVGAAVPAPAPATVTISDGLIVLATLIGPVLAVQAQKWVERARRTSDMRTWVFTTLMNTRATRMSTSHIEALNSITIAFNDGGRRWRSQKSQTVLNKWKEYLAHLSQNAPTTDAEQAARSARGTEIFTNLLEAMAVERGFEVDRAEITAGAYHPQGFVEDEMQRAEAVRRVMQILRGESGLPVSLRPEQPPQADEAPDHPEVGN